MTIAAPKPIREVMFCTATQDIRLDGPFDDCDSAGVVLAKHAYEAFVAEVERRIREAVENVKDAVIAEVEGHECEWNTKKPYEDGMPPFHTGTCAEAIAARLREAL